MPPRYPTVAPTTDMNTPVASPTPYDNSISVFFGYDASGKGMHSCRMIRKGFTSVDTVLTTYPSILLNDSFQFISHK